MVFYQNPKYSYKCILVHTDDLTYNKPQTYVRVNFRTILSSPKLRPSILSRVTQSRVCDNPEMRQHPTYHVSRWLSLEPPRADVFVIPPRKPDNPSMHHHPKTDAPPPRKTILVSTYDHPDCVQALRGAHSRALSISKTINTTLNHPNTSRSFTKNCNVIIPRGCNIDEKKTKKKQKKLRTSRVSNPGLEQVGV